MTRHNPPKRCSHLTLLRNEGLNIEYCSECGVVHVELEFISVKFRREAFAGLVTALSHAESNLQSLECGDELLALLKRAGKASPPSGLN
ncbi:MAG: hypothetical protein JO142_17095 [Burkholderiales bacterium]|nr:hypothetical protein [Burkholderiales bacterium]